MSIPPLSFVDSEQPCFPDPESSLVEPNGLLAISESLTPEMVSLAYSKGIFPWYGDDEPIMWWSPDPRAILMPYEIHLSRSLKKFIRQNDWTLTINRAFEEVINYCAKIKRPNEPGTWITREMQDVYTQLHLDQVAHSVEVWDESSNLIGGLYGVITGCSFSGESMFSLKPNASKVALSFLAKLLNQQSCWLIDCQLMNPYLASMGAKDLPRAQYLNILRQSINDPSDFNPQEWQKRTNCSRILTEL